MNFIRLFEKRYTFWGVEIGEDELLCSRVDTKNKEILEMIKIESGSNFSQFGIKIENLEKGFSQLKDRIKIDNSTRFNISLPSQFTVPKNLAIRDKTLIEQEILSQIPFPLESVYYDYVMIDKNQPIGIFLAVKREIADSISSVMNNLGLQPGILESEYFSSFNILKFCKPEIDSMVIILVFIHQTYTTFVISHLGVPVSYSDARVGFKNILEDVMFEVDLEWNLVQKWLLKEYDDIPHEANLRLTGGLQKLSEEICKNLNLLKHLPELKDGIDEILIFGNMAKNQEFIKLIQDRVGVDTKPFSPFEYLKSNQNNLSFINSLGAALRKFGDKYDQK